MSLIFFAGGRAGACALRCVAARQPVAAVVAPPPKPAGRKQQPAPAPAAVAAAELNLPVLHAPSAAQLAALAPQTLVVCDYGRMLTADILALAPALNIHPSLLPQWRGAAPVARAVLAGDTVFGVTIMQVAARLDAGDIVAQERVAVAANANGGELLRALAKAGAELLLRVLSSPAQFAPTPQDEAAATYAKKIVAADRLINFNEAAVVGERRARAFAPTPGAHCFLFGERIKVFAAKAEAGAQAPPGRLLAANDSGVLVACGGGGALRLKVLQRGGRRALPAAEFLRGFNLAQRAGEQVGDAPA